MKSNMTRLTTFMNQEGFGFCFFDAISDAFKRLYIDQNNSLKSYVHISKTNAEHDQKFDIFDLF